DLERLFAAELAATGLAASAIETFSTPRRLALIARGLPEETEPVREERRGPRADAPDQAIAGFLGSTGLARDALETREDKKGSFLYAILETPGRPMRDVLAEAIPRVVRDFPWPKSMRWGAGALRWVRPLQGIVALFGGDVVPLEIEGISSGATTVGHRFRHPGAITIGGADDYAEKLRACHVILDHEERAAIIRDRTRALAAEAGLDLVEDEQLVTESAALTEWPVPLHGSFDETFLDVPPEVITLTMRTNQKYFALTNPSRSGEDQGRLAPNFICTANIDAADGGASIVAGNRKVLAARLADARYFWEQDRKTPLAGHAQKLDQIVFHEKLGTVADKVERVAKLAKWLVEEGIVKPSPLVGEALKNLADLAETAARLCKADLVTQMVGEFPELQGVMGGHYARAEGLDPRIAAAIRDHYKPAGQGDEVPTEPVTVAVALADRLDTLFAFFAEEMLPTGSKDPFALRRAGLGVISLLTANDIRMSFIEAAAVSMEHQLLPNESRDVIIARLRAAYRGDDSSDIEGLALVLMWKLLNDIGDFFADRLKVQQREAGVRHDLIDAVFALGGEDDLVRLLARVRALQAFVETDDGADLLAAYKRAANILKKEGWGQTQSDAAAAHIPGGARDETETSLPYAPEPAESALLAALAAA
ncbi:MAG: glycine--tRNA ligase subunit beta, partial [Sphingomonadaceae bacterium]|nr:glycine--tRNA ligase subunit beta [Sphingomonadaceae bacterium]